MILTSYREILWLDTEAQEYIKITPTSFEVGATMRGGNYTSQMRYATLSVDIITYIKCH